MAMIRGSCLCGAVAFELRGQPIAFGFDHCSRCRKASGSAFAAELICRAADFRWTAGESIVKTYEAPVRETPPGYRRVFCSLCGASVPAIRGDQVLIPAGTIDDDPGIRPQAHIFVAYKAPWFEITDNLPQFAKKPPGM
jgi:hypothetical protein